MKPFQVIPALTSIISLASAQTPAGFSPAVTKNLNLTFVNNVVLPPGELIPRAQTVNAPNVSYAGVSPLSVILMIDLDVPGANATAPRQTLLHWFAPNVTSTTDARNTTSTFKPAAAAGGAPYLQPNPPVGDIPHRYVVLLFAQPRNFSVSAFASINPPADTTARRGFNITNFIRLTGLSAPLAANYFTVQNSTNATAAGNATATAGANATRTSSPAQVTRNAGVVVERGGLVAFVIGAAWAVAQL